MKVAFCTLGCKVNQYDTDAMREMFINAGHTVVDFDDIADVYVINTCTVTSTGDKNPARWPPARIRSVLMQSL